MTDTIKKTLLIGGAVLATASLAFALADKESDLTTVGRVDLNRYVGRWYEIARYPNRFQKQCTGEVTATYSKVSDGKIEVLNECRIASGKLDEAKGKAKIADKQSNAKLRVTFFWPFYGDYWVIGLDKDYRWAVVGEPSRKYLWILSRTPEMSPDEYQQVLAIIRQKGYSTDKLLLTRQAR